MRKDFGSRLKSILENNDISQKDFAEKLEITEATLSRYINNLIVPKIEIVDKMANFLGVTVDYLIGNDKRLSEVEEMNILRKLLVKKGFMSKEDEMTDKELDNAMKFLANNREFLKNDKKNKEWIINEKFSN